MKWTNTELNTLENLYPDFGLQYCQNILPGRTLKQIKSKIGHLGLQVSAKRKSESQAKIARRNRPDLCNVQAKRITSLDSKEACYILGLLWADGYLINKGRNPYKISIEMKEEDLSKLIPVFETFGKWTISRRIRSNRKPQLTLSTSNKELFLFLEQYGYCNKKTGSTKILEYIPQNLQLYWIRGFFDGDGCCYINKAHSLYQISFAGHYEQDWSFLKPLQELISLTIVRRIQNNKSRGSVARFQGKEKLCLFAEFIYPNLIFDFGLKRKFDKFIHAQE